jgi:SET domain-containing protein
MFCIETYLAPSSIHGIGCFSNQTVKQAEIVARRNPHIDQEISQQLYDTFSENEKNQIKKYAWKNKENGNIMLNTDDTRFLNHSDTPNL